MMRRRRWRRWHELENAELGAWEKNHLVNFYTTTWLNKSLIVKRYVCVHYTPSMFSLFFNGNRYFPGNFVAAAAAANLTFLPLLQCFASQSGPVIQISSAAAIPFHLKELRTRRRCSLSGCGVDDNRRLISGRRDFFIVNASPSILQRGLPLLLLLSR